MEDLRPNDQRATYAVMLIWIVLAMEIISFISSNFQYELLQSALNGASISSSDASSNDTREQAIAILFLIANIVSVVTFIQWFRRAYYNLHLKVKFLTFSEGWAAGAWFVPIVCLYRPFQIMKELYEETNKVLKKENKIVGDALALNYLGIWWGIWVITNVLAQFTLRFSLKSDSVDELLTSTILSMVGNILGIPLAIITIKIIKDYSKVEFLLSKTIQEELPAPDLNKGTDI